ncbi:LysR substrate-binding domain-containing protein [Zoogloea sp.]|uniref:LysR substrate-binding domain-containing protein n=1 Tax=Zoogloea sp. TaxID=49181 RepID=UPI0035AFD1D3
MSVSLSRIPSVDLLRRFVAVGRRMSITLAAGDLFLTQSAVSRQIHALEAALGVKLFERGHRSIRFTAEGEQLFLAADAAMQTLQDALGVLEDSLRRRPVTITASIGFVSLWLLPRLREFQSLHPDVEVRLSANNEVVDLRQDGLDIAIRYCAESAMPAGASRLFGETLFPVAHPSLGLTRLDSPALIEGVTLLEFEGEPSPWWQWSRWLESQGWVGVKPKGVLRFNLYDQVIHAAVAGQGIALGRGQLIAPMLADGRLVALSTPLPGPQSDKAHYLIQRDAEPSKQVRALIDWIRAEARLTDVAPA